MRQMPCGLLRDAQVAVDLHTGRALDARGDDIEPQSPILIAELRALQDRPVLRENIFRPGHSRQRCVIVLCAMLLWTL